MAKHKAMHGERILVIGAASAIAQEVIRIWAKQGARLFLVARDEARLKSVADDARVRGAAAVESAVLDVTEMKAQVPVLDEAWKVWDGLDGVLIAHGWLPDQSDVQDDARKVRDVIDVNATSVCEVLARISPRFEVQGKGWLAAISSVAGVRGRSSIYVYGAAKALVSHYLAGMRHRFAASTGGAVRVIDLRPGPIDTPMTAGMKLPLLADVSAIAPVIVRACARANGVVYVPGVWWAIMNILAHVPEKIWLRMKI